MLVCAEDDLCAKKGWTGMANGKWEASPLYCPQGTGWSSVFEKFDFWEGLPLSSAPKQQDRAQGAQRASKGPHGALGGPTGPKFLFSNVFAMFGARSFDFPHVVFNGFLKMGSIFRPHVRNSPCGAEQTLGSPRWGAG